MICSNDMFWCCITIFDNTPFEHYNDLQSVNSGPASQLQVPGSILSLSYCLCVMLHVLLVSTWVSSIPISCCWLMDCLCYLAPICECVCMVLCDELVSHPSSHWGLLEKAPGPDWPWPGWSFYSRWMNKCSCLKSYVVFCDRCLFFFFYYYYFSLPSRNTVSCLGQYFIALHGQ